MPRPLLAIQALLLLIAVVFLGLHAVHISADFPNHSPWMDWSKYTDEGWYGDAAIRHFELGHWNVPGDFNPAAALPVWPLLEMAVFKFTGVSLAAARGLTVAVFALTLLAAFLLVRRWQPTPGGIAPAIAVALLAVSPFCFAFTRMAILEPLLVLTMLAALLAASACWRIDPALSPPPLNIPATPATGSLTPAALSLTQNSASTRLLLLARRWWPPLLLGLLLPTMVLTKTTALFLFPALVWMLWAGVGYRPRVFLRAAVSAGAVAACVWGAYFALFVRPRFLTDYRYLFSANAYTAMTRANAAEVLIDTFKDGAWIGPILYPLALVAIVTGVALLFRRPGPAPANALIPTFCLWAGGYTAFLAYHANLQPRYYLVVAVPLTLLVPVVFEEVWQRPRMTARHRLMTVAGVAAMALILTRDGLQTLDYVRHPDYTLLHAAEGVRQVIQTQTASDPTHNPLLLSISGSDITLMTGIPSICDDFGTMELSERVNAYKPGWYAAWNQVEDDKMDALTPQYHLERVAEFPAMDDPDRNVLILYRLDPPLQTTPRRHRKRRPVPRSLQTALGQQPSTTQLVH